MPFGGNGVVLGPDLVALLQEMGLTWDEIRIYQVLLNAPAAVSSAIVRETGHSRGRIYETLRRLAEKGFVREEPTRPIQFHPTPLADILAAAQARLTRQLTAVKESQAIAVAAEVPGVALPLVRPTRPRDVRVLSGRRACHAEWNRMLEDATQFFWISGGGKLANRLAAMPSFLHELRKATEAGLSVQAVLPDDASTARALDAIAVAVGPDFVHAATVNQFGPLVSCATDQAAMETIVQPDDEVPNRGDDVGIQVSSDLFATAMKQRLELAQSFLEAKGAVPVYQWLGPNHGSDLFLKAIADAKNEVLVLGPSEWTTYLTRDWGRHAPVYKEAKSRGVRFRALTNRAEDQATVLAPFTDVWDIRVVDGHPVWLTLVDDKELYQAFTRPSLGGPPQFRHSREPNEVHFYSTVFERLWANGEPVVPAPPRA